MKKFSFLLLCTCFVMLFSSDTVFAHSEKPHKDVLVWEICFVKTVEGKSDACLQNLSGHWVKLLTAARASGPIVDYKILSSPAARKNDWNLMLMTEVKDYDALADLIKDGVLWRRKCLVWGANRPRVQKH